MPPPLSDPAFSAWLAASGVRVSPSLAAVADPAAGGGRAIVATAPIAPGEELVAIPAAALLSSATARADPAFSCALGAAAPSAPSDECVLASYLLVQDAAGPASPWAPFLATLPHPPAPLLGTWDENAVAALACPAAVAAARAEGAALDRDAAASALLVASALGKGVAVKPYAWAAAAVRSRSMFFSPTSPAGALVPFGDLFNHGAPPPGGEPDTGGGCRGCAGWHGGSPGVCPRGGAGPGPDLSSLTPPPPPPGTVASSLDPSGRCWGDGSWCEQTRTYTLTARCPYEEAQEVRLCYGRHSNLALLSHYGFTLPDGFNPADVARLLPRDFPAGLLEGEEEGGWAVHASGAPGWGLLAALRRAAVERAGGGGLTATPRARSAALAAVAEGRAADAATDAAALGALARAAAAAAARLESAGRAAALQLSRSSPFEEECRAAANAWREGQAAILRRAAAQARRAAEAAAGVAVAERRRA